MLKPFTEMIAIPLQGGAVTRYHKSLLPFGGFSAAQNVRGTHPGFNKRLGQIRLHSEADGVGGANEVLSLYQFRKNRISEKHFFAQMSDGDILEAITAPPGVTTGAFGSEAFSGSTGQIPAAWSVVNDILVHSNGVDQHKTYTGDNNYISALLYFNGANAPKNIPEAGVDYTVQATDGLTTTVAVLDNFGPTALPGNITGITKANPGVVSSLAHGLSVGDIVYFSGLTEMTELNGTFQTVTAVGSDDLFSINDTSGYGSAETTGGACGFSANTCIFICTPVPATKLTWTMAAANSTASVGKLYYRKSDSTWADTSMTDGTISSGKTLGQTGSMTWTAPTDEIPMFMYGQSGFWYQLRVTVALDAEVEVSKLTFGSGFHDLVNVWDGVVPYAVEAIFYDQSAGTYDSYATGAVDVSEMTHSADDTADRLYFDSADPIQGVYIDVGSTPNTNTTTVILGVYAWNGTAFTSVGTITDGTNGFTNSGWITWPRFAAQPHQFKTTQYYAYWYYIAISTATMSADMTISIQTMPYFDIEELGHGQCSCAWKSMMAYTFTLYGNYVYISPADQPLCLNGSNFGILKAGDGRTNKVVAMRNFYNEMLVFQEERGVEGGCVTLFQGYSPDTFGKLVLSTRVGTFNNKSLEVVDGVLTATATEEKVKTLCFFLSRYGVCATDGISISVISDDIQNYFDPSKSECIRRGYESKMWLSYDSSFNVIRIGLVSGSSATLPNVFPVLDLVDNTWSFDTPAQELSCMVEAEADSGNIQTIQIGGGIDDGTVYLLNSGTNDVSTAIDSYVTMELNAQGRYVQLNEMLVRAEAVAASAGDITITLTKNTIAAGTKTLTMSPEVATQTIRRHRFNLNVCDQNISVKLQNNAASKTMKLLDIGFRSQIYEDR